MLRFIVIAVVLCASALAQETPTATKNTVNDLSWLAGCWGGEMKSGTFEECWTAPMAGNMQGSSRRAKNGKLNFMEFMLLEDLTEGVVMTVQHFGSQFKPDSKPVSFTLVRATANEAVFENPQHDYPQRIAYRKTADGIVSTISLLDGTKQVDFPMKRPRSEAKRAGGAAE
jgi:hypothetical protein